MNIAPVRNNVSFGELIDCGDMSVHKKYTENDPDAQKISIKVADKDDKIILGYLDAIADRNREILEMRSSAQEFYNDLHGINRDIKSAFESATIFESNGYEPIYDNKEEVQSAENSKEQGKVARFLNKINLFKK